VPNAFEPEWQHEYEPFKVRIMQVGRQAGARELGASVYEIDPGGRVSPFHVHHANEELLLVMSGRPTLRTPKGERELDAGEVVAFPPGPEGAHQVLNNSDQPARVLVVSTMRSPDVVEHLDSGKLLASTGPQGFGQGQVTAFRRADAVEPMTDETAG
jgi:uncharacterized cupin superfamily protein